MRLFVYGTLVKDTPYYDELVKPYIDEEKTETGVLPFTNVGGAAVFQFGGVNELPGYYYTINVGMKEFEKMIEGLDEHESSPRHFRLVALRGDLIVYEWNYESRGWTTEQVMGKAAEEMAIRQSFAVGKNNGNR